MERPSRLGDPWDRQLWGRVTSRTVRPREPARPAVPPGRLRWAGRGRVALANPGRGPHHPLGSPPPPHVVPPGGHKSGGRFYTARGTAARSLEPDEEPDLGPCR